MAAVGKNESKGTQIRLSEIDSTYAWRGRMVEWVEGATRLFISLEVLVRRVDR